jgi:Ca-activated chloride channel family protein
MKTICLHPGVRSNSLLKSVINLGILGALLSGIGGAVVSSSGSAERVFAQQNTVPVYDATEEELGGIFVLIEGKRQAFLLEKTTVNAQISGNISRVEVTQIFTNPFSDPLEALYQFPLPDDAAVDDMEIRIGSRVIRGVIKPREAAQEIYQQAKEAGKTAGLLEEDRPNLFSQSLANILPGEKIEVVIRYSNSLIFSGGNYEFRFPTLVDDRYDSTTLGSTVPNSPLRLSISIDAGVPIQNITSPSHSIRVKEGSTPVQVSLTHDVIPDQDLIVRYQVSGAETQATILTQKNEQGGHFAVYVIPALDYTPNQIIPKDVVFLVDTSGSQSGAPMAQSKELMRQFINGLNPEDTFAIVDFSDTTRRLAPEPFLLNRGQGMKPLVSYGEELELRI